MNVQKFKAYWEKIGRPDRQVLWPEDGSWLDVNGKDAGFHDMYLYRIKDDPHWELRQKWIDSDFTLPIEKYVNGRWISVGVGNKFNSIVWSQWLSYREAIQPISFNGQDECIEADPGAHYRYEYKGIKLDPGRIAQIYEITHPMQFTALKKILKAGERGHKDLKQDLADIKGACDRWLEMIEEDSVDGR